MKAEDLLGFIFFFGAGIIATMIIMRDFFSRHKTAKPYFKWSVVVILSLWQVGCWRALSGFGSAFGNGTNMQVYEIGFIVVVCLWCVHQLVYFIKSKKIG